LTNLIASVRSAASWCAAPFTALVSDDLRISRESWTVALEALLRTGSPTVLAAQPSSGEGESGEFTDSFHLLTPSWQVDGWLDLAMAGGTHLLPALMDLQ
jgi:hypothetical protein